MIIGFSCYASHLLSKFQALLLEASLLTKFYRTTRLTVGSYFGAGLKFANSRNYYVNAAESQNVEKSDQI